MQSRLPDAEPSAGGDGKETPMKKLVLLRHGESTWNKENRFTGWTDVPLNETGVQEGLDAGRILKKEGYTFDEAYTSVLKRATTGNFMAGTMVFCSGRIGAKLIKQTLRPLVFVPVDKA